MGKNEKIKLLFITQKIKKNDDDLAFVILWVKEFIAQGMDVKVICLEKGEFDDSFSVYSLGKENGNGILKRIWNFYKYIFTLDYNRVFIHMNCEYVTMGGWYWFLKRIPIYLWYTHYKMHIHLWLSGIFCQRMFAATAQSMPQYENSAKKIIIGHGVDINYWLKDILLKETNENFKYNLLVVHRICRSKRLELIIRAIKILPEEYNLTVYGRDAEKDYHKEILDLIKNENLENRIKIMGPLPMSELKNVYPKYRLLVNMASETIDKTMVEAMLFGIYTITTPGNSQAIGLPIWPAGEKSEDIAQFILKEDWKIYNISYLQNIVKQKHSLRFLIGEMNKYIKIGK
jgi:glycosyltransferase involved in cell wall biosynthesis